MGAEATAATHYGAYAMIYEQQVSSTLRDPQQLRHQAELLSCICAQAIVIAPCKPSAAAAYTLRRA